MKKDGSEVHFVLNLNIEIYLSLGATDLKKPIRITAIVVRIHNTQPAVIDSVILPGLIWQSAINTAKPTIKPMIIAVINKVLLFIDF
jgi:hypothetical protein